MSLDGTYENGNIFAKILRGEAPSVKVFEDGDVLAFMDVFPQSKGHTLVIPKQSKGRNILEVEPQVLAPLILGVQRVTKAVRAALNPDGIMVSQFNGAPAGQTVYHLHFHIIPRWDGVALGRHGEGGMADVGELKALAEQIAAKIAWSLPQRPWFETDAYDAYIDRSDFDAETKDFIRHMAEHGYAAIDLGDEARALCDQAMADADRYLRRPKVSRVQDAWYRSRAIRQLAAWPRVRELLAAAYGRDPFPFQTLNFGVGSQQPLHADTIHFNSVPERFMCGVWIALEDVTEGSGPLVYHPGSHKLPVMTMRDAGVNSSHPTPEDYGRSFVPRFAERIAESGLPAKHALLKKGWAFVWAANLAHGGSAITEPGSTRRSLVVHCYFEDCLYYTPITSDESTGRYHLRIPANIRTGGWTWPRLNGRPAKIPAKRIFGGVIRDVLRWPFAN